MKEAKYIEEKDNRRIEEPDDGEMEIDLVQLFAGMWKSLAQTLVACDAPCGYRSGGILCVSDSAV